MFTEMENLQILNAVYLENAQSFFHTILHQATASQTLVSGHH